MAKQHHIKQTQQVNKQQVETVAQTPSVQPNKLSLLSFRTQSIILCLVGFIFYCNTFNHEYAFDDMMAIVDNDYVQQGFAGIPKIMSTDAYQSYLEHKNGSNQLSGGRYRPLSLITFAIEQQFLGTQNPDDVQSATTPQGQNQANAKEQKLMQDMHIRHIINVLLYMLTCVVLLYFFRQVVFLSSPVMAFIAALLFTIHPSHTEVVANVKSRDEILSVLFISLTFIQLFKYIQTKRFRNLGWSLFSLFLALLSKEYAVTLVILLPLSLYIFKNENIANSFKKCLPYLITLVIYFILRLSAVTGPAEGAENNVMNNPYIYATTIQKFATEIVVLLHYIQLLFLPYPLVVDYSYAQIPYTNFTNPLVWLSLLINLGLIGLMCLLIIRKNALGFALAIYYINLVLISNFLFNIGAPMGERLIFHSGIGFCLILAFLLVKGSNLIKPAAVSSLFLTGIMIVLIAITGFATINRNKDWKNNETLFLHDVVTASNSVLVNNDAAASCMSNAKQTKDTTARKEWLTKAIGYFTKAISLNPKYSLAYLNRGLCFFNSGIPDKALPDWDTVRIQNPEQQNLSKYLSIASKYYMNQAMKNLQAGYTDAAITSFNKALEATPNAPEIWYNLGLTYMNQSKNAEAKAAFEKTLQLSPNNADVLKMLDKVR